MKKFLSFFLLLSLLAGGCVVQEIIIRSEPPGARVFIDTEEKGVTPCTVKFTFYGNREVVLRKEGYLSAKKVVSLPIPWFEYFPLDFFCEILIPFVIRDEHEFSFKMEKIPAEGGTEEILRRAGEFSKEKPGEKK